MSDRTWRKKPLSNETIDVTPTEVMLTFKMSKGNMVKRRTLPFDQAIKLATHLDNIADIWEPQDN